MLESFDITPEYCLIARAFQNAKTLRGAARLLNCDPAALVRKAKLMQIEHGLLYKLNGRWELTEKGRRATLWVEQSIRMQQSALNQKPRYRISSNMWFAEQVLIPQLNHFSKSAAGNSVSWMIRTADGQLEENLLNGRTDFAIACHAPNDPRVAYRKIAREEWVVVVPRSWGSRLNGLDSTAKRECLKKLPFLKHSSIEEEAFLDFKTLPNQDVLFDGIIPLRAAVGAGLGWSCLPRESVRMMLHRKEILEISYPVRGNRFFSLWYLRGRDDVQKMIPSLLAQLTSAFSR